MRTFYFNTGVRAGVPSNERHKKGAKPVQLGDGQVWRNGLKQIPFDCENVPDNAILMYLCGNDKLHENDKNVIVREVFNTKMLSKYAYFSIPNSNTES